MKKTMLAILSATLTAGAFTCAPVAFAADTVVATTTTNTAGEITEFSPETIIIRSESAPQPIRYSYTKTTTYVDENGAPVSMELVKSGLPVTVYYTKDGDRMIASKVVVRKKVTTTTGDAAIDKKTTTTTTTDK